MKISVEKDNGVAVVHISGSLDADSVAQFKKKMGVLCDDGFQKMIVNADELEFIDSMGLGAMISLLRKVRSQNGDIKVAGLTEEVRQIFEITRLHRLFDVFGDWQSARDQF